MKPDITTSLAVLLNADAPVLVHLRRSIDELLAAKSAAREVSAARAPAVTISKAARSKPVPANAALTTLAPMKPPRPGSLRADIYRVLSNRASMSRADIISELARFRHDADKSYFASKVHDNLNRPHDRAIERIGRGLYRLISSPR